MLSEEIRGVIQHNRVFNNNKLCKANEDTPVTTKGGGILLLGATHTLVTRNREATPISTRSRSTSLSATIPRT